MTNRYHSKQASKMPSSGASNKAPGSGTSVNLQAKQKERSGGTSKKGWFGPFHVKSEGL